VTGIEKAVAIAEKLPPRVQIFVALVLSMFALGFAYRLDRRMDRVEGAAYFTACYIKQTSRTESTDLCEQFLEPDIRRFLATPVPEQ